MGFMLFQHIASGAETVLCAFCMAAFFRPYMAGRKNRLQKTIAVFLAYGTVYVAGEALSISGWLCMVIVLLLLMAGGRWLCMERKQVLLYQGYGQADNGKPVLSFQWENRAGAGQ